MSDTPIKTRREGGILEVTIDRPKANAIDLITSRIMGKIFQDFRDRNSSAPAGTSRPQRPGTRSTATTVSAASAACRNCAI
jgi:hypothetical protein